MDLGSMEFAQVHRFASLQSAAHAVAEELLRDRWALLPLDCMQVRSQLHCCNIAAARPLNTCNSRKCYALQPSTLSSRAVG
jgi:hypothetical protein